VWRVESQLGEEVQVDFMQGPMVVDTDGKRRRTWILRMVLSFSPKGYCEGFSVMAYNWTGQNGAQVVPVDGRGTGKRGRRGSEAMGLGG
jgi:hypothetical protein